jgi:hypothetical protein
MLTVAPAGIATPFEPLTAPVVVAVMLSPTALVFVQTLELDARLRVVPAATVPVVGPVDLVPVDAGGLVVVVVVVVVFVVLVLVGVVFVPVRLVGALVIAGDVAVSFSCGLAAVSALANARFAARAESLLSESVFAASLLQAASVSVTIARDAAVKRVYFTIGHSSLGAVNLSSPLAGVARGASAGLGQPQIDYTEGAEP